MAKVKLDAAKGDVPEKRADIDKYYVVAYTKLHGTPEQRAAIKAVIKKNTVKRTSNFDKSIEYTTVDMKEVREVFCKAFFSDLNTKKGAKTFDDEVEEL